MDWVEVDTPEGRLRLSRPRGQVVYSGIDAVTELPAQDPEWSATLDGQPIPLDVADEILTAMRDA